MTTVGETPGDAVSEPPERSPDEQSRDPRALPPWYPRAVAVVAAWVVGLLIAYWALLKLQTLLVMILVAVFLSLAMEPGVDRLARRGWRRGPASGLILGVVLVGVIGFLAAAGSVFIEQASDLVDRGPQYIRDIEKFLDDEFGVSFDAEKIVKEIENVPDETVASSAFDVTLTAFEVLFEIVTVLVFAFYLAADGPRLRRSICSRLPRRRQEIVLETWELAVDRTGAYIWSRTILATISAVVTYAFLLSLGIENALALGIWVGVISQFIPTVGTYIAMVLPVIVALQDGQPIDALWVLLFLVAYQQIENYVLMPRITKQTMEVHPALAIGTVFAGGLLLGGVGAVLALPATAVVQSLVSAYTTERAVVDNPMLEEPADKPSRWAALRARFARRRADVHDDDTP